MPDKLGILAAAGPLPGRLVEACRQAGRDFVVVAYRGMTDPSLVEGEGVPHFWTRLGAAGRWIDELKRRGFNKPQIQSLLAAYRTLFDDEGQFADRIEATRQQFGDNEVVQRILAFIDADSGRNVMQPPRRRHAG